ncbi:GPI anchored protein [Colletotrichum tofieldiae]|uniref:GPI anchored protein n=1 Tax=Colletotrichum tofieldiae TaxID=708197 RepID=A0A166YIY5_9PEZI|nr:GPI anchored protein [Colletotrichum tofieldiae]
MKINSSLTIALCWLFAACAQGHTVISYPGWRGNTFITNETYPFGMQWTYPCGGLGVSQNRTHWPIDGGAIAVQPGWNAGHKTALMYVNLGLGEEPKSYTTVMVPRFLLTGPTNEEYEGTFCLPKVPIPKGVTLKEGDMASIQVVQAAQHGAALFSCVDVIFTEDESKVPPVTDGMCFNSTDLKIEAATLETNSSPITEPSTATTTSPTQSPTSAASRTTIRVLGLISLLFLV